jgi:hypothetical protein
LKAVDELPEQKLIQLIADIDRISDMTDEVGQAALMALAEWRDQLGAIDSAHQRAHWLYVRSRDAFRQAEEIRYADENQNAQRLWDGFVGPRLLKLKNDPQIVEQFKEALRGLLGAGRVHIEIFGRVRSRSGEPDREIKQVTVCSEDIPVDEVVFTTVGVKKSGTEAGAGNGDHLRTRKRHDRGRRPRQSAPRTVRRSLRGEAPWRRPQRRALAAAAGGPVAAP